LYRRNNKVKKRRRRI